ncbi:hypothetical protein BDZ91DRAFT_712780 [Kalaharituber pfeilii]|nr:hypothetical protein BDZ91DRAFT_712780 [Kalaharituber pfeilii]
MLAFRTARVAARCLPWATATSSARTTGRRAASTEHGRHEPAHEETFGKGFFITIAILAGTLSIYKLERSITSADPSKSPITRLIGYYSDLSELWRDRNERHTAIVVQAGRDRALFQASTPSRVVPLRYLESFNHGSPRNNEAGRAGGNLLEVKKYLEGEGRHHQ